MARYWVVGLDDDGEMSVTSCHNGEWQLEHYASQNTVAAALNIANDTPRPFDVVVLDTLTGERLHTIKAAR